MGERISRIKNDEQDRTSEAWLKLCAYIDALAESGGDEFEPRTVIGGELFAQIYTLPESISKLKKVKKIWLYGSNLKRIPPEIGAMESLEYFDVYTSYDLRWFPYELTHCKKLKDSRVSTRAVFGNYKNRKPFPDLTHNPVRYTADILHCSVCKKEITYSETNQLWIMLRVATDVLPLLVNLCSQECESQLPAPPPHYVPTPHKGGAKLEQSKMSERDYTISVGTKVILDSSTENKPNDSPLKDIPLLKVIRKIWEK